MAESNYAEARKAINLSSQIEQQLKAVREQEDENESEAEEGTSVKVTSSLPMFQKSVDPIIKDFNHETALKTRQMNMKQQQELDRFEERWGSRMKFRYMKHSEYFYKISFEENECRQSGEQQKADALREELIELQQQEDEENERRYIEDYEMAKEKLLRRFDEERKALMRQRRALKAKAEERSKGIQLGPVIRDPVPKLSDPLPKKHKKPTYAIPNQKMYMGTRRNIYSTRLSYGQSKSSYSTYGRGKLSSPESDRNSPNSSPPKKMKNTATNTPSFLSQMKSSSDASNSFNKDKKHSSRNQISENMSSDKITK